MSIVKKWSAQEEALLRELYPVLTTAKVAQRMNRTVWSVKGRARQLGLMQSNKCWTQEDKEIIRALYPTTPAREIAALLGASVPSVTAMARVLKVPMLPEGRSKARRNWQAVGSEIVINGQLLRKVSPTGPFREIWRRVDVLTWEEANGPIPAGMIVTRADLKAPPTLSNLILMTRAQIGRRNNYWVAMPREVAELYGLRGAINRQVNRLAKQEPEPSPPSESTC